jgi:hypothetical protein
LRGLRLSERFPVAAKKLGEIETCHADTPFRDAGRSIGPPGPPCPETVP